MRPSEAYEGKSARCGYDLSDPLDRPAKGVFVITGLDSGGAENMLVRLLSRLDRRRFATTVISLTGAGKLGKIIEDSGISVHALQLKSAFDWGRVAWGLVRLIRGLEPDFVQGWMLHGNLAAEATYLACGGRIPIIWNIRHALHEGGSEKWLNHVLMRVCKTLSSRPKCIVYNSWTSAAQHEGLGYDSRRRTVIPNGFDCDVFRPCTMRRRAVRASLRLGEDTPLIGLVARVHPVKDHPLFLRAARELASRGSQAHFLLVGAGTDSADMLGRIRDLELVEKIHALGERSDIPELTAALDLGTSCSRSEAFPNAVGEAMASGVPCVVTGVGDSEWIVGGTGRVVPCADSIALCNAWQELLEITPEERSDLGVAARDRILEKFSLNRVVSCYERLYSNVIRDEDVPAAKKLRSEEESVVTSRLFHE